LYTARASYGGWRRVVGGPADVVDERGLQFDHVCIYHLPDAGMDPGPRLRRLLSVCCLEGVEWRCRTVTSRGSITHASRPMVAVPRVALAYHLATSPASLPRKSIYFGDVRCGLTAVRW